jgi:predicted MFS family arabinose efflux permease
LAQNWLTLAVFLVLAGIAAGIAQPASSLALARGVPFRHQGMAFGLKQSSGAFATLLGGISVPLLGLTVGWRWAFVGVALLCVPLLRTHRGTIGGKARVGGSKSDVAVRPLRFLALATVFTVMATSSMAPFYVESVVARGIKPATAGILFAVGSVSAIFARLLWGNIASRRMDLHFVMIATLQGLGSAAFLLMAFVGSVVPIGIATVVMFAAGWGWPGLLTFAVVSRNPKAPAVAAGIVVSGQFGGGIVGPLGFGFLVEATSYRVAWVAGAGLMVIGATLSFLGGRNLDAAIAQS